MEPSEVGLKSSPIPTLSHFSHNSLDVITLPFINNFDSSLLTHLLQVLIHSAAGGVGLAVVQLAKHFGLEVVATVSSDSKADMLKKDWGVAHVVNYRTEDFHVATRRIYGAEKCVDIILDPNGTR